MTRSDHDRSWVADLETDEHATDRRLVVEEALDAVAQTRPGVAVDLVTHARHGHPAGYLYGPLRSAPVRIDIADGGRCQCGGYVTRVTVRDTE